MWTNKTNDVQNKRIECLRLLREKNCQKQKKQSVYKNNCSSDTTPVRSFDRAATDYCIHVSIEIRINSDWPWQRKNVNDIVYVR